MMAPPVRNTVLVVADGWDAVAAAVSDVLRSNGFDVVATTASALVGGAVTYLGDGASTMWASSVAPSLGSGERSIASHEVGAVLNRAVHLDGVGFADEDDESYASCERTALFVAMIESLDCPVLNRSQGTSLSGPPHYEAEWMSTAVRCGLPVRPLTWTPDGVVSAEVRSMSGSVTVIADRVMAESGSVSVERWAHDRRRGLLALAANLGCELVRLDLGETADGTCVVTRIDPRPPALERDVVLELARHLATGLVPVHRWEDAS